ncbi:hypothetical protein LguiA_016117 [Lonicera macranthoides]
MSKFIIGGVPTLGEAKAATAQLKDVIDSLTCNLSSNNSRIIRDKYYHPDYLLLLPRDTTTSAHSETVKTFSLPKQATQAFSILSRYPVVVSSLVHDPKVWDAVMQNQAVVELLKSNTVYLNEKLQSDYGIENVASEKCFNKRGDLGECDGENWLRDSVGKIRGRVIEMVRGLSDYFQKLFRSEEVGVGIISDKIETGGGSFVMGLGVMVIMVVLLKRNYY